MVFYVIKNQIKSAFYVFYMEEYKSIKYDDISEQLSKIVLGHTKCGEQQKADKIANIINGFINPDTKTLMGKMGNILALENVGFDFMKKKQRELVRLKIKHVDSILLKLGGWANHVTEIQLCNCIYLLYSYLPNTIKELHLNWNDSGHNSSIYKAFFYRVENTNVFKCLSKMTISADNSRVSDCVMEFLAYKIKDIKTLTHVVLNMGSDWSNNGVTLSGYCKFMDCLIKYKNNENFELHIHCDNILFPYVKDICCTEKFKGRVLVQ